MSSKKRILQVAAITLCMSMLGAMTALASTKTISSVSLRVNSKLEAGTTLPDISYNNTGSGTVSDGDICITNTSNKYSITAVEWVTSTSKEMTVGSTPELKVTLTPETVSGTEYAFKGTYRSSNVSIRYGTFTSASKSSGNLIVRLKVKGIEGDFSAPEDAYWKDNAKGTARWEEPESGGTGRYEVILRRGSTKVHSVETTSRSYNFYPYMTKEGTYTFRVRTIAKTSKEDDYGNSSEWVESYEIYLAKEDVSDGSGQTTTNTTSISGPSGSSGSPGNVKTGWQKENNSWYYYFPDGSYKKNGWEAIGGRWYLFQSDGKMLSGWQNVNNQVYYFGDDGAMWIGWIKWGQYWYYMNPTPDAYIGCMLRDRWLNLNGKTYYFDNTGAMIEGWKQIEGNTYYFYPSEGNMAVNTNIGEFYVNEQGIWVH